MKKSTGEKWTCDVGYERFLVCEGRRPHAPWPAADGVRATHICALETVVTVLCLGVCMVPACLPARSVLPQGPEIFFNPEIFSSDFTTPLPDVVDESILKVGG